MGIDVAEYERRWDEILRHLGGSLGTPSGWAVDGNYHSCARPPIYVPNGSSISAVQRQEVIERAEVKYLRPRPR